ncbi:MAG: hypothetical protein ACOCPW_01080 [Marinilabiliaceae bacterium]
MKMDYFGKAVMVLLVGLFLAGCQDDDIAVTTDAENDGRQLELAGPAGDVTLEISDLLEDIESEHIHIQEDGLVNVRYEQNMDIDWETLVLLRDFYDIWQFSMPSFVNPDPGTTETLEFTEKVKLNHQEDVRYDSITMRGGTLAADLTVPPDFKGTIDVTIPEVMENGSPLSYQFDADGTGQTFSINEDLTDRYVEFSQGVDSSYISVVSTMEVEEASGGDYTVEFSLTDMQPGLAFGYFGQQEESRTGEQLSFDVFDEFDELDDFELADVQGDIEVTSTIGVPFDVEVDNMRFTQDDGTSCGDLMVDGENYVNIGLPSATYGNPIDTAKTDFHIGGDNSNLVEIVNCYPTKMVFDVTSSSNPEGDPEEDINFMGHGNELAGKMVITIPAWFKTNNYSRRDTIDFDVNDMLKDSEDEARDINELNVNFNFSNKLPFGISATATVIDDQGRELDELFNGEVIRAGTPNSEGYIEEAEQTEFEVGISGDQINQYLDENAMKIILETETKTPGDDPVKLYEDMFFKADVSFEASGVVL